MKIKSRSAILFVFSLSLHSFAMAELQGKWVAKKYLQNGIESNKVSQIPKMVMKPEHFGYFMYLPNQELKIEVATEKKSADGKQEGRIQTSQPLLDPSCSLLEAYKSTIGCSNKNLKNVDVNLRLFEVSASSSEEEKLFIESWNLNKITDITQGFSMIFKDYSTLIGFVGRDHLLLRGTYYEKPLKNSSDAVKLGCPEGNRCWIVFMQFDRQK